MFLNPYGKQIFLLDTEELATVRRADFVPVILGVALDDPPEAPIQLEMVTKASNADEAANVQLCPFGSNEDQVVRTFHLESLRRIRRSTSGKKDLVLVFLGSRLRDSDHLAVVGHQRSLQTHEDHDGPLHQGVVICVISLCSFMRVYVYLVQATKKTSQCGSVLLSREDLGVTSNELIYEPADVCCRRHLFSGRQRLVPHLDKSAIVNLQTNARWVITEKQTLELHVPDPCEVIEETYRSRAKLTVKSAFLAPTAN